MLKEQLMTKSLAEQLSEDAVGRFLAAKPASAIVDVSAAWCAPCRWLGPIVQKVAFERCRRHRAGYVP